LADPALALTGLDRLFRRVVARVVSVSPDLEHGKNYMLSNLSRRISRSEHLWQKKNVVLWALIWSGLSLFIYIFFGGAAQGVERQFWYRISTAYVLQNLPPLIAGLLCIRNGLSRRMPSGSKVWLLIGISLISYLLGNIFFSSWELVWHLNSTGSLGDPFFVIFYICLLLAMIVAIWTNQVRLQIYQWAIVLGIAIYSSILVMWILKPPAVSLSPSVAAVSTQISPVQSAPPPGNAAPEVTQPARETNIDSPEWVMFFDRIFKPYGQKLNTFYVWCDVALFTLAAVMTLAFWGGRMSHAWQINAQAIVCFYIADMWFAYAGNQIKDYQGGFMLESFWILGVIQFGVAAAVEFEYVLARNTSALWGLGD
jgi:hypothetical protein